MATNPLVELQKLGQSPWHDNIRRDQLTSGKLERMVANGDITGLTSNPTIFQKAIAETSHYDRDLESLARQGKNAEKIFYALAIDDIRNAADIFAPVHARTNGKDGFVSIEVSPRLAYETDRTIEEAHRLWKAVDRPNLMVKIPATKEGLPAIEECIADGLSINVTLIFSLERYDEVMNAYLNGLIRRAEAGEPVDRIASVASFFVSRVDTLVDKKLDQLIDASPAARADLESLKGKAAVANAKLAFEAFRRKFSTESYAALRNRGAQVQRPLWASTSTKNPAYPDTYYVEALVGPDSVDTMPPDTIDAFRDHGKPEVRIDLDVQGARDVMRRLEAAGIDMRQVTHQLEEDGVKAFADSFESVLATVEERRLAALSKPAKAGVGATKRAGAKKAPAARKKTGTKKRAAAAKAPARKKTAGRKTRTKSAIKTKPAKKKTTTRKPSSRTTATTRKKKAATTRKGKSPKKRSTGRKPAKRRASARKTATRTKSAIKTSAARRAAKKGQRPARKKAAAKKPAAKRSRSRRGKR